MCQAVANRLLASHHSWRDVYLRFPRDADGRVPVSDLEAGMKSLAGVSAEQAAAIAAASDRDGSGRVGFTDFVSAMSEGGTDVPTLRLPSYWDPTKPQGDVVAPARAGAGAGARAASDAASVASVASRSSHRRTSDTAAVRRSRVLRRRIQDAVNTSYGSDGSALRKMFLKFNRGGDGAVSYTDLTNGLRSAGVSVSEDDVKQLFDAAMPMHRNTRQRARVDYDVFHKAIEQLDSEPSAVAKALPYVHSPPPVRSREATRQTIPAVCDAGLEFPEDDADTAVAKKDTCRKLRSLLAANHALPREAFLVVDRNRDALLSQDELQECVAVGKF